jgi:uncharacterized protein (TIGR04255 family)
MPFPEVQRVLYNKNPLDQVVCQLRFPPILRIDAEIPAQFQERIRGHFPNYAEAAELAIEIRPGLPGQVAPELLRQMLQSSGSKNYEFSSEDGIWKINLTRTFVALTTTKYTRWEEFKEKLEIPLNALIEVYAPDSFSRVGLRYVNVIRRSVLGLSDIPWSELLQPYIAGILGAPGVSNHVQGFENTYEVRLADGESVVRIVTRLVEAADDGESCFMIDSDYSNMNKTAIQSAVERLNYFNIRASRLIQWSITDRLHQAMEPTPL